MINESQNKITWLHIGDLHSGLGDTASFWPNIKDLFLEDIKKFVVANGTIDVVVFSGDFAQKGAAEEFQSVERDIEDIFQAIVEYGSPPKFFFVPGNHDLVRPDEVSLLRFVVDGYAVPSKKDASRKAIFGAKASPVLDEINLAFSNYKEFVQRISKKYDVIMQNEGYLPGDSSGRCNINGYEIGFVGLNTTWSQVAHEHDKEQLQIDIKQLQDVTNQDAYQWTKKNDINILVGHHPADWFEQEATRIFTGEIAIPRLFDFYLNGHVHENVAFKSQSGGSSTVYYLQTSSLFGVEKDGYTVSRHHGYYFAELYPSLGKIDIFPKNIEQGSGGNAQWFVSTDTKATSGEQKLEIDIPYLKKKILAKSLPIVLKSEP